LRCGASEYAERAQECREPEERAAEVVSDGGHERVGGVAGSACDVIASHAVLFLQMADDGFDG
jgi:hypothetical protein